MCLDDGVWEAEATNAQKQRVDLKLDPDTATIISEKLDDSSLRGQLLGRRKRGVTPFSFSAPARPASATPVCVPA